MKKSLLLFIIMLISALTCLAQKNYTGNEAANRIQKQRKIADQLFDKKDRNETDILNGVLLLKKALVFLDSLPIKELASTNAYLWYSRSDVNRDLASGYALLNKKDSSIIALNRMYANGATSNVIKFLQQNSSLNGIRNEPGY